eukprot:CAMPEP_0173168826 /NCGR_PEP_ID=MMETSP1141-20130122/363_1 /TAXON_ID=483371 /ORGANISM="non described non described, Strain CCMP2298" /LENGTH=226 /DNA_ID=CAMNT_0014090583 /DNA_START=165 /DNA_END=841 /DNA_ORIENTATION=-
MKGSDVVKLRNCSGCETQRYCSKECQTADWPLHKAQCKSIRQARKQIQSELPDQSHALKDFDKWRATFHQDLVILTAGILTFDQQKTHVATMNIEYRPELPVRFQLDEEYGAVSVAHIGEYDRANNYDGLGQIIAHARERYQHHGGRILIMLLRCPTLSNMVRVVPCVIPEDGGEYRTYHTGQTPDTIRYIIRRVNDERRSGICAFAVEMVVGSVRVRHVSHVHMR